MYDDYDIRFSKMYFSVTFDDEYSSWPQLSYKYYETFECVNNVFLFYFFFSDYHQCRISGGNGGVFAVQHDPTNAKRSRHAGHLG